MLAPQTSVPALLHNPMDETMLARHTGPALLVRAVEAAPPIEMRNVFHNPVDKDMIAPDAGPALVVMPINDHGHADPPCRCLGSMSAAEVLRKSPPSLGTACPTVGTTTMQRSRTTGTGIRSSTANNGQFMQVENDYLRVVPASRLREFAEFLRNQGPKTSDPRFVASCTCITKECMLGLDAGLILRLEADVRLAAYHAYILPVWGAVRDFVWPSGVGDGGSGGFFWTNEHGDKGGNGTSAVPDSTFCVAVLPVSAHPKNKKRKQPIDSSLPSSNAIQTPPDPPFSLRAHAIIEFKAPGALSTIIVHDYTQPRIVTGESSNWNRLTKQLRKYAKQYQVTHQVVMDDEYSIYIEFDLTDDDVVTAMVVPHEQKGAGIWEEDIPGAEATSIRLNSRELICFLLWNGLRGLRDDNTTPLSKDAIQKIQQDVEANKSKKRTCTPFGGGAREGLGERPPKRLASLGKNRDGGGGKGYRDDDPDDEVEDDAYSFPNTDHEPTGYLPPRGTIFQLILKPTTPRCRDDSGYFDNNDRENVLPRTMITNAITHLMKGHVTAPSTSEGACAATGALRVRMKSLLAPNVGIVEFLGPDGKAYTTASALPNCSSRVHPLSCIVKSHPQRPRLHQTDSYLGEYMAYQAMTEACTNRTGTSTLPLGLPAFFGAWDYASDSTSTPLFPILLLENLRATPLKGITLAEWIHTGAPHPAPAVKLEMLPPMRESVVNTLKWVQENCNTVHRDLSGGKWGNLLILPEAQGPPVVAVVDWGLAATGEVVEGEAREDWEAEEGGDRATGAQGRRMVQAVKGWGRSDIAEVGWIFQDVRAELVRMVEEDEETEEEQEEDEGTDEEEEEEDTEIATTPAQ